MGKNVNCQLGTSSEKLVASLQFVVVLVTSEPQFSAILTVSIKTHFFKHAFYCFSLDTNWTISVFIFQTLWILC